MCKNLYAYCDNNPVCKTDLYGEIAVSSIALVVAGAGINVVSSWVVAKAVGEEFTFMERWMRAM